MSKLIDKLIEYLTKQSKIFAILLGTLLAILIGGIDWMTKDYFVFTFYTIPVILVTWFAGRNAGIFIAFVNALAALVLDIIESPRHTSFLVHYWNAFMIFTFFLIIVYFLLVLKNALEDLKISEANYRSIFEMANDGIFILDINTYRTLDANKKGCEMFCYLKEEMVDLDLKDIITDDPLYNLEKLKQIMGKAAKGEQQVFEWLVEGKAGRSF